MIITHFHGGFSLIRHYVYFLSTPDDLGGAFQTDAAIIISLMFEQAIRDCRTSLWQYD